MKTMNYKNTFALIYSDLDAFRDNYPNLHLTYRGLAHYLTGTINKMIATFKLNKLGKYFGILKDQNEEVIRATIFWFVRNGFLIKNKGDKYNSYRIDYLPIKKDFDKMLDYAYDKASFGGRIVLEERIYDIPTYLFGLSTNARHFLLNNKPNIYHSVMAFFGKHFYSDDVEKVLNSYLITHSNRSVLVKNKEIVREIIEVCIKAKSKKLERKNNDKLC